MKAWFTVEGLLIWDLIRTGVGTLIGEGDGTPLQYSCLENPMDGGAWWAAVYGVAQSQTRLKLLSSSSSSRNCHAEFRLSVSQTKREKYL